MDRRGFGAVSARENGDIAALVPELAREFFHDRRFARAADGEIANGDDLDAERGITQDPKFVKELAGHDGDVEDFLAAVERGPNQRRARAAPLFQDDR